MNNLYKILFFTVLISSTLISISSSSWLGAWMGLEINLISFIPLISNSKNMFSSESAMKYFIVQALASTALLFSIVMSYNLETFDINLNKINLMILNSALLMKMGAAPFHFWFPEIMNKINWSQSMILLTWQKIAPMSIISYSMKINSFMFLTITASIMVGSLIGLNQTMMQKIMAYSSINHIGWMLSSMMIMENIWLIYFTIYSIISVSLITIFNQLMIFHMKQLFSSMNNNPYMKFSFLINFLSLGGLPPFLGFLPKWIVIQNMVQENFMILTFLLIMFTLITLYFYLRISFSILLMSYNETNWLFSKPINKKSIILLNTISSTGLMFSTMAISYL